MRKKLLVVFLLLMICIASAAPAFAAPPSRSYTYDPTGLALPSPLPYTFDVEINGDMYGLGTFNEPEDVFIDSEYYIYLLDSGNQRVVIFDENKALVRVLNNMTYRGEKVELRAPEGLFVYEYYGKKLLYIADSANARILRLDMDQELDPVDANGRPNKLDRQVEVERIYTEPNIQGIDEGVFYKPTKLIVDRAERIFALCRSVNRGVVKLTKDGDYDSFFGAPEVTMTITDKFWRLISTKEQLRVMARFVPTEYSNISTDSKGFVYVTASSLERQGLRESYWTESTDVSGRQKFAPVRKLAADGTDILARTGIYPPVGDIAVHSVTGAVTIGTGLEQLAGYSTFVDVAINEYDVYSCIDDTRCKVFTYDSDGNMLFVFGGPGTQYGTFQRPVAVSYFKGDQLAVLDKRTSSLVFFTPTDYGAKILSAVSNYKNGRFEESEEDWVEVLKMNSNMIQAYRGVGKSLLRAGEYKEAMANFKISKDVEYYSKALEAYIKESIGHSFTYIFIALAVILLAWWIWKLAVRFRRFLRDGVKKVV